LTAVCLGGAHFVIGSETGKVLVYDARQGTPTRVLEELAKPARGVACGGTGPGVAAVDADGNALVTDLGEAAGLRRLKTGRGTGLFDTGVGFSPDGARLALGTGLGRGGVEVWGLADLTLQRRIAADNTGSIVPRFAGDEGLLFTGGEALRAWDPRTGKELQRFAGHREAVYAVGFSPDGKVAASGAFDSSLRHWDLETGAEIRTHAEGRTVLSLDISRDGTRVCMALWDGLLRCRDARDDRLTFSGRHPDVSPRARVSPTTVATSSPSGTPATASCATGSRPATASPSPRTGDGSPPPSAASGASSMPRPARS